LDPLNKPVQLKPETPTQTIDRFFASIGWKPFAFQRTVWRSYRDGYSGLLHSATGTGKTLGVWMGPILKWLQENPDRTKWNPKRSPPARVLWITPLRALAGDTEKSLRAPLDALGLPWTLDSRTGDSKQSAKQRQLKKLPTALVTTPESLSLMLTHEKLLEQLKQLECVIVDEWHELLGTKRGIQTELALSRLRTLNPDLRIWGVSATLGNLDQACEALMGDTPAERVKVVQGHQKKKIKVESVIPKRMDRFPWSGHIGTQMVPQVVQLLDSVNSALVFTNTRSQTEIWYQHLLKQKPEWAGQIAIHHGSLDMSVRRWVENGLREGRLKAVVCTSSLDLGVDFTAVDLVIQIGSPKGAARLLQRAGRSGHQPDATSRLVFVPTNAIELIELAAAQDAIRSGRLEARPMLNKPLDVLAQHVVTIAIGGGFNRDALLNEVRTAYAYKTLTESEWQWVLDFVVRGGESLEAYPDYHRVEIEGDRYQVTQRRTITNHRMNIGTIVADASMQVKYLKGKTLGTAEESFLSKLQPGKKFLFAGRLVELVRVKDNAAYVLRAKGKPDAVPRWIGARMPLSSELSEGLRRRMEQASEGTFVGREMKSLKPLLELQAQWSTLPRSDELLVERVKTRGGHHVFLYPFEGRLVHEGLAALFAYRLSKMRKQTFSIGCNDHGIVLQSPTPIEVEQAVTAGVFATGDLVDEILKSMNSTEMAKRQFRQIARVAGLIHPGLPGRRKSAGHLQASSNLFFDVFCQYDPDNMLLEQSRREVLEQQLEASRMHLALQRIQKSRIVLNEPNRVTPLAFGLLVDKLRERVSSETLADRIRRMQADLELAAGKP
jgi:ATP-dependent Lhr-like helicase